MRRKLEEFQVETGDFFNRKPTPAEGTSYRFARLDKKKFPEILFANGKAGEESAAATQAPYYTNSTHLPVNYSTDIFDALDLQDKLQGSYTGGTVLHGYLGEEVTDTKTVRNMVLAITDNYSCLLYTSVGETSIKMLQANQVGRSHGDLRVVC
ncbi:nitrogenase reductase protein nifH [Fibrobacteres bacterium R8-0-B4]